MSAALLPIEQQAQAEAERWLLAPIERPALPAVQAYHLRLLARPAFKRLRPGSELT